MSKGPRTQAMRALDARDIAYTTHTFPATIRDAELVAQAIGQPAARVYKTLVALRDDPPGARPMLVMIPADQTLDLRAFARAIGAKSCHMATHDQAEALTGLKVGGISALALLNKPFAVFIDARALALTDDRDPAQPLILVSGGQRGVDLELRVADLLALTQATPIVATVPKT